MPEYAYVEWRSHRPLGEYSALEAWIHTEWIGQPWWLLQMSHEMYEDMDWSLFPYPLLIVEDTPHNVSYTLARRDEIWLATAVYWWPYFRLRRLWYWRIVRPVFRFARRHGYGYVREGVAFRWRDLFARKPEGKPDART